MKAPLKITQAPTWEAKIKLKIPGPKQNNLRSHLTTQLKKCGMTYLNENTWKGECLPPAALRNALAHVLDLVENPTKTVPSIKNRLCADVTSVWLAISKEPARMLL